MPTSQLDKEFSIQKLTSAIRLIDRLRADTFAYGDSKVVLDLLRQHFSDTIDELKTTDPEADYDILIRNCAFANSQVDLYKDFVGMVLRSNSVRNAFEIYTPLKGLAKALLDGDVGVIVSSEFDFIPFIYPIITNVLRDFIFIGLPASEGQNALLIPIAAHELGHAVWRRKAVNTRFSRIISVRLPTELRADWDAVKEFFPPGTTPDDIAKHKKLDIWKLCWNYAARQAEEIFCDFIAYWLFGSSYSYSFRYLLAPGLTSRTGFYPRDRVRAQCIVDFADLLNDELDEGFLEAFPEGEKSENIILTVADRLVATLVGSLQEAAISHCQGSGLKRPAAALTDQVVEAFQRLAPAHDAQTMADIINAGWRLRVKIDDWDVPGVSSDRKIPILSDLVYKSLEVLEWQTLAG